MRDFSKKNILAIAASFPSSKFPEHYIFVKNILLEMAKQGADINVIAPLSWTTILKTLNKQSYPVDHAPLKVQRPITSKIPLRFFKGMQKPGMYFNDVVMSWSIERSLKKNQSFDFCYAHFLPAARAALKPMKKRNVPIFLNLGESDPWEYDDLYDKEKWIQELSQFAGIMTVSKRNRDYLLGRNPSLASRLRYIPNGVDTNRFKPLDQKMCREKLGLPKSIPIAVFSGHFEERKGPLRVLKALQQLDIKGLFLGTGIEKPIGDNVLMANSVVNEDLPLWLNAADVFVLPTLSEGMSNSILEALACGLPLVVSDKDFNREFLTEDCTQFVDPWDSQDIAKGIKKCLESEMNYKMRQTSVQLAKQYSIEKRVCRIHDFVREMIVK